MSREYSKVRPRFWTGDTGKVIRKLGRDCQVIGFYLMTCPSANMLGLYYLSMPTLCHETESPFKGALKALRSLQEAKFAYYDMPSEIVYVPNMAREQIGERLKRKDNRHVAVLRELESLRKTPFFNDFVIRYRDAFELHDVVLEPSSASPLEGPSKPLRSQEQEQEQKQEQEQSKEGPVEIAIPNSVNPRAFQSWIEYRRVERKPIRPHSFPALFKKMTKLGNHQAQADAVEHSISNGYQGLFAERSGNGSGTTSPRKTRFEQVTGGLG
jgi:hypothetical protein